MKTEHGTVHRVKCKSLLKHGRQLIKIIVFAHLIGEELRRDTITAPILNALVDICAAW